MTTEKLKKDLPQLGAEGTASALHGETSPALEMVEISIDGQTMNAPKGGNLLQFMTESGIEISYFCYHPGLSVVAVCRQCLVELKNSLKLVPACQTLISAGMEIINSSPRVLEARRQLLEFTLLNHPIDCPICDKAGECILQKHYMDWNHQSSRIDHPKIRKPKRVDLGPRVILDNERCILCSRCVRFCTEIVGDPQLVISKRGNHSELTTAPGRQLDNPYSLNTVDICPVGALTDKDFRFKVRVWELCSTLSVCNGCATGCTLEIHHHRNKIYRLVPRRVKDVNLNWMCDYGRYTYKAVSADRLNVPQIQGRNVGWNDAIAHASHRLKALLQSNNKPIGFVLGADVTNEDNFVAAGLAYDFFKTKQVYLASEPAGKGDNILRSADPNPNRAGAIACGRNQLLSSEELAHHIIEDKFSALYVIGDVLNLPQVALDQAAAIDLMIIIQATHPSPLVPKADIVFPAAMWPEVNGTITNAKQITQRLRAAIEPPDFARPHWQILVDVARRAGMTLNYASPREIFNTMKQQLEFFSQADWGQEVPAKLLRYAGSRG